MGVAKKLEAIPGPLGVEPPRSGVLEVRQADQPFLVESQQSLVRRVVTRTPGKVTGLPPIGICDYFESRSS